MESFLETVARISSKDYQLRVWINCEGPEVDDFSETVNHFFQEGDGILDRYHDYGLTEEQYKILENFRNEFEWFADENDLPVDFINSEEWKKVVIMAKKVLESFNYKNQ
ncbi:MAG: hypothetical protein MRY21_04040 [Simkaniaceae bacterium]|nr:hypothetical protein [Simkaniaceae bacterium]